jgi:hypothetical protein
MAKPSGFRDFLSDFHRDLSNSISDAVSSQSLLQTNSSELAYTAAAISSLQTSLGQVNVVNVNQDVDINTLGGMISYWSGVIMGIAGAFPSVAGVGTIGNPGVMTFAEWLAAPVPYARLSWDGPPATTLTALQASTIEEIWVDLPSGYNIYLPATDVDGLQCYFGTFTYAPGITITGRTGGVTISKFAVTPTIRMFRVSVDEDGSTKISTGTETGLGPPNNIYYIESASTLAIGSAASGCDKWTSTKVYLGGSGTCTFTSPTITIYNPTVTAPCVVLIQHTDSTHSAVRAVSM